MAKKNANNASDSGAEDTAAAGKVPQKSSQGVKNDNQPNAESETRDTGVAKIGATLIDPKIQAYIFAGLAVLGTAFLLFGVIGKNQILDRLSHIEHARGLITFTLTVGTISIAILVTLGALMGRDGEARERFYRAKEILTILIGVLGTIVGFYFGSQDSAAVRGDLKVASPILSAYTVNSGQTLTLTSFVSGGKPPYKYEVSFEGNEIESLNGYADDTGWVFATFTAPKENQKKSVSYTLNTTDADEKTASYISAKDKRITIMPP